MYLEASAIYRTKEYSKIASCRATENYQQQNSQRVDVLSKIKNKNKNPTKIIGYSRN